MGVVVAAKPPELLGVRGVIDGQQRHGISARVGNDTESIEQRVHAVKDEVCEPVALHQDPVRWLTRDAPYGDASAVTVSGRRSRATFPCPAP